MEKILSFLKSNWKYLIPIILLIVLFFSKIKDFFASVFNPSPQDRDTNLSGSDYIGLSDDEKGIFVDSDGREWFRYGKRKVQINDIVKSKVVQGCDLVYNYVSSNAIDFIEWLTDDTTHFYKSEIISILKQVCLYCNNNETWIHYFAYIWLELHNVPFIDYLKSCVSAEDYEQICKEVPKLNLFYY